MKIKILEINQIYPFFGRLVKLHFSAKTSYKLAKLINNLEAERAIYTQQFQNMVNDYAEKDEDGNPKQTEDGTSLVIKKDCLDKFEKEYNDLLNLEVEIPDVSFAIEELEGSEFTPFEMMLLEKFIVE